MEKKLLFIYVTSFFLEKIVPISETESVTIVSNIPVQVGNKLPGSEYTVPHQVSSDSIERAEPGTLLTQT